MGAEDADDNGEDEPQGPLALRPPSHFTITGRRDLEMDAIGWLIFLIMIVLLIPLVPILLVLAAISKLLGFGRPRAVSWDAPRQSRS